MITRTTHLEKSPKIRKDLLKYFYPNDSLIIFDIGSCEGEDSYRYARLFPNATIYAFEPLSGNFGRIESLIRDKNLGNRIHAFPYALSNHSGKARFHISSGAPPGKDTSDWDYGNKSSSLYPPGKTREVHKWLEFNESIEVDTLRLQQFCAEQAINHIDFIHMDVQGAELDVLKGAGDLIDNISMIWMEVHSVPLYADQPLKDEVEGFMAAHHFSMIKDTVDDIAGDQLYVKNTLGKRPLISRLRALLDS